MGLCDRLDRRENGRLVGTKPKVLRAGVAIMLAGASLI
jgi:hypothetical protein